MAFLCRFLMQTATRQQKYTILISSVKEILKAITDAVIFGLNLWGVRFLLSTMAGFSNERVLWA